MKLVRSVLGNHYHLVQAPGFAEKSIQISDRIGKHLRMQSEQDTQVSGAPRAGLPQLSFHSKGACRRGRALLGQAESGPVTARAVEGETMSRCPLPDLILWIPGTSGRLEKKAVCLHE